MTVGLVTAVTTGAASLLMMVPMPEASAMVAPTAELRETVKVSFDSKMVSLITLSVMVLVVSPGAKVSVPERGDVPAVTSAGIEAVPAVVA